MANHKSAIKRIRTNEAARSRNRQWKSRLRTVIREVRGAATAEEAEKAFAAARPIIDSTATRGVIHKNTAARYKSELDKHVKKLAAKSA